jgi:hypothetical protein
VRNLEGLGDFLDSESQGEGAWLTLHKSQACVSRLFWLYNKLYGFSGPRFWELGVRGFTYWCEKKSSIRINIEMLRTRWVSDYQILIFCSTRGSIT